jgi:hypothetical protein
VAEATASGDVGRDQPLEVAPFRFHPPIKNPSDDGLLALAHPGKRI